MKISLTESQWERISEILGNLGLLVLASLVLPFILGNSDASKLIWGIVVTGVFWYISIVLAMKY